MLDIKTDGNAETYCITFSSDEIRSVLACPGQEEVSLEEVESIAIALADYFDENFAEWVYERSV